MNRAKINAPVDAFFTELAYVRSEFGEGWQGGEGSKQRLGQFRSESIAGGLPLILGGFPSCLCQCSGRTAGERVKIGSGRGESGQLSRVRAGAGQQAPQFGSVIYYIANDRSP
jgi:hypothetical protein